jgi:hypothetical protein
MKLNLSYSVKYDTDKMFNVRLSNIKGHKLKKTEDNFKCFF